MHVFDVKMPLQFNRVSTNLFQHYQRCQMMHSKNEVRSFKDDDETDERSH